MDSDLYLSNTLKELIATINNQPDPFATLERFKCYANGLYHKENPQ